MLADVPMFDGNSEGQMSPTGGEGFNPVAPGRKAPNYMFNSSEDGSEQDEGELMQGLSL